MTRLSAVLVGTFLVVCVEARAADADGIEFFEKKVRPVLAEHCFKCHGSEKQKGHLRLDSRAAAIKGGDNGPALVPGDAAKSLLIRAVRYMEDDLRMPPKSKLPATAVADLAEWVRRGAPWPEGSAAGTTVKKDFNLDERRRHWCWQAVKVPALPAVSRKDWPRSPIDHFLLAKLEAAGIAPAPPADRRTLVRRVTFDLTGLPPTPAEIEATVTDPSENWFEKVVDRLLASPHYGERWGRHWLDLVRYAETYGHEYDFNISEAYRYRDYIIRAFNADLPYDQLVREHVAGDLLPKPRRHPQEGTNESILGTGFWFLGEAKHSPVDLRVDEADRIDNQIDVFSKAFLGLTVSCARCHDHKFDAITTKDYYALMGYLQSARYQVAFIDPPERLAEPLRQLKRAQDEARLAVVAEAIQRLQGRLEGLATPPVTKAPRGGDLFGPWRSLAGSSGEKFVERRRDLVRRLKERLIPDPAAVVFADASRTETWRNWSASGPAFEGVSPRRLEVLLPPEDRRSAPSLVAPGTVHSGRIADRLPGIFRSPTFVIPRKKIAYQIAASNARVRLVIDSLELIRDPIYGQLEFRVNHGVLPRWYVQDVAMWVGHKAYIEIVDDGPGSFGLERVVFTDGGPAMDAVNPLLVRVLDDDRVDSPHALARKYREFLLGLVGQWRSGGLMSATDQADRIALLNELLHGDLRAESSSDTKLDSLLREVARCEASLPAPSRGLAMTDGTPWTPRVYIRGNPKTLGDEVPRRFLEVFVGNAPSAPAGSGRLQLAERLTDPANPLVARVMVNRIWQHHFGEGLVRSVDNFGVLGETPTHPELLDWLAAYFTASGDRKAPEWSIKKMHRLMLLSHAYQMASRADDRVAEERDPQNRLLHRMAIRRLEAEAVRDSILAISGRLDPKMYGPSVMPHLTPHMAGRGRPGSSGPLDGAGRRSIYIGVRRNFLTPMFLAFDYPIPFTTMGRRSASNVPAQALTMLNNPFVLEQADLWAKRVLADPGKTPQQRMTEMYLSAFGRPPTEKELAEALTFLKEQGGPRGWADLCHVLMNVKEFIFIN